MKAKAEPGLVVATSVRSSYFFFERDAVAGDGRGCFLRMSSICRRNSATRDAGILKCLATSSGVGNSVVITVFVAIVVILNPNATSALFRYLLWID